MSVDLANNFDAAMEYTQRMRDTFLGPHFYRKYAVDGRYVYIDKSACSTVLQKELAVDTVMQVANGSLCIEEKIEQWHGYTRKNFALETDSCTVPGHERKGWMHYAKADYLLYAFAHKDDLGLDVYFIHFPKLREWFWSLPKRYPSHTMEKTYNHTRFEKVPILDVRRVVPTTRYLINCNGCHPIKRRASA